MALSSSQKAGKEGKNVEGNTKGSLTEGNKVDDDDDQLLNEMEELTNILDKKKKKAKKLLAKRREKDKARKAMGMQIDATEYSYFEQDLFCLSAIKGQKQLSIVNSTELNSDDDFRDSDDEEPLKATGRDDYSDDVDSDEEQKRYNEQLEEMLDEAYERFVSQKGGSTKQQKCPKRIVSIDYAELEGDKGNEQVYSEIEPEEDQSGLKSNTLLVPLIDDEPPIQEQMMEKWFTEAAKEGMIVESDNEDDALEKLHVPRKIKEICSHPKDVNLSKGPKPEQDEFEIVPAEPMQTSDDSSSSSDESEDDDTKAEILAYAKKMLRKKQREVILDDAYNKYTKVCQDGLLRRKRSIAHQ